MGAFNACLETGRHCLHPCELEDGVSLSLMGGAFIHFCCRLECHDLFLAHGSLEEKMHGLMKPRPVIRLMKPQARA